MITKIYFVRHAHSDYSSDERERNISEEGKRHIEKVSKILIKENIEAFISSPYKRAIQTIEGAAGTLNIDIVLNESFRERTVSLLPVENFEETIKNAWEDSSFALQGGESNIQAQQRGIEGIQNILKGYKGRKIAIGTHGNIMAIIMNYYDSYYNYDFWKSLSMPDIYKLSFSNDRLIDVERIWEE